MSVARRIILLNAAVVAVSVAIMVVGLGFGASDHVLWRALAGWAALSLAAAGLMLAFEAGLLARWLSVPLLRLRATLDAMGWGDFSMRVDPAESGALSPLATAVDGLGRRLDDASARRRALEAAVEKLDAGLVLADGEGVVAWVSGVAGELLGIDPGAARGERLTWLVADDPGLRSVEGDAPPGDAGLPQGCWEAERVITKTDGGARWLRLQGYPLGAGAGEPSGQAVVVRDEGATRDWRDEQRRLAAALGEANRLRMGLFGLIRGGFGARLASAAGLDWEIREMLVLLDELGDVDSGYLRAVVQECPLRECVEDAVQARAVLAATRGAGVQVAGPEVEVQADRGGLVRCLSHMLGAALHAAIGPVRVMIGAVEEQDDTLVARVDMEVIRPDPAAGEVDDLVSSGIDAALLERAPGPLSLSLYLAGRYAFAMRARLDVVRGAEGALVLRLRLPLSPMAAAVRSWGEDRPGAGLDVADPLTGLASLLVFERALAEEVHRAARLRRNLSVLALRIDDLDRIAREHGAGTADRVVREVAEIAKRSLHMNDLASRSGDGLLMLLYNTPRATGMVIAEKLRYTVSRHIAATPDNRPAGRLSISLGLASFPEDGDSARQLLEVVQGAMARDRAAAAMVQGRTDGPTGVGVAAPTGSETAGGHGDRGPGRAGGPDSRS